MHLQISAIDFATFRFVTSEKNSLHNVNTHCLWLPACAPIRGGRNGVVNIATRYRLDGPGIESRWFPATVQRSLLYRGYRVFAGVKATGSWRWTPTM